MNGLELGVREADPDQERQRRLDVKKALQLAHESGHLVRRRRDEGRLGQRAAGGPDPVLAGAERTGRQVVPADTGQQALVNLPDEADRDRQRPQSLQPVVHGPDVVEHLVDIVGTIGRQDGWLYYGDGRLPCESDASIGRSGSVRPPQTGHAVVSGFTSRTRPVRSCASCPA